MHQDRYYMNLNTNFSDANHYSCLVGSYPFCIFKKRWDFLYTFRYFLGPKSWQVASKAPPWAVELWAPIASFLGGSHGHSARKNPMGWWKMGLMEFDEPQMMGLFWDAWNIERCALTVMLNQLLVFALFVILWLNFRTSMSLVAAGLHPSNVPWNVPSNWTLGNRLGCKHTWTEPTSAISNREIMFNTIHLYLHVIPFVSHTQTISIYHSGHRSYNSRWDVATWRYRSVEHSGCHVKPLNDSKGVVSIGSG